jgi:hypothetical protein
MNLELRIKNKKLIGIGVAIAVFVIGGLVLFISLRKAGPLLSPLGDQKEKEPALLTWEDPAGFTFTYPEGVEIDPHQEDTENYAHLELTSSEHAGKILIWVKETDYQDIEAWAKKEVAKDAQVLDTQLGEEPAKKVASFDPEKLAVAAIDVNALVLLEMEPDEEGYWQGIFDQILESFAFIPIEGEETTPAGGGEAPAGGSGVILEEEEVIE